MKESQEWMELTASLANQVKLERLEAVVLMAIEAREAPLAVQARWDQGDLAELQALMANQGVQENRAHVAR